METTNYLEKNKDNIYVLGDELYKNPELGYKEFRTKEILVKYLKDNGFKIENECFETCFTVSIGKGHPHIGLIAELDAIPTLGHPFANKNDSYAAHSCGHSTQCAIMSSVMAALKQKGIENGKVTLFFTPAEEFTDVEYRRKLIKEKKIKYIGGKINMLEAGMFDDVDMLIHCHTMGQNPQYHFSLGTRLGGFVHKKITFKGKASHAAVLPYLGINALNAFNIFETALNALRETFRDEDKMRIHGFVSEGGQTVNSIPERVIYECYVRSMNLGAIDDYSKRVDNAAVHSAKAIGASAIIKTTPGYLPLEQEPLINDIIRKEMYKYAPKEEINDGEVSMAAGDVGDISLFKPVVQFGYTGFKGMCHGKDLCIVDKNRAYTEPAKIIVKTVEKLLSDKTLTDRIIKDYKPRMSKEDYLKYINQ